MVTDPTTGAVPYHLVIDNRYHFVSLNRVGAILISDPDLSIVVNTVEIVTSDDYSTLEVPISV